MKKRQQAPSGPEQKKKLRSWTAASEKAQGEEQESKAPVRPVLPHFPSILAMMPKAKETKRTPYVTPNRELCGQIRPLDSILFQQASRPLRSCLIQELKGREALPALALAGNRRYGQVRAFQISSPVLEEQYYQYHSKHTADHIEQLLLHGTGVDNAMSICENGFSISCVGKAGHGQAYGAGFYFTDAFRTALRYAAPQRTGDDEMTRVVLVTRVSRSSLQSLSVPSSSHHHHRTLRGLPESMFVTNEEASLCPNFLLVYQYPIPWHTIPPPS